MPSQPGPANTDTRERLRLHFLTSHTSTHPGRWDELWQRNETPWDQGRPSPALVDLLSGHERRDLLGGDSATTTATDGKRRRKKALVPGCGKGYDVLLFARYGYESYGIESSPTAVKACEELRGGEGGGYAVEDQEGGRGEVKFLEGDFFRDGWFEGVDGAGGKAPVFDVVYDYTFLSALPPSLRPAWALRMSQLLAENGTLICLEFPTYKPPLTGGPPWALPPPVYLMHLSRPGEEIEYNEDGSIVEEDESTVRRNESGLVRVAHWQPKRTHEIGKGTDWVSLWRHR
ncbi:hypothetical protein LTR66_009243 [Elasticomyces elasticus]|nr:hypothetical protein LTR66_009243 [Elasticomyces elasticus]